MKKILGLMFVSTLFISGCSGSDSNEETGKGKTELYDPYGNAPYVDIRTNISNLVNSKDEKYKHLYDVNNIEAMDEINNFSISMSAFKFSITNGADTLGTKILELSNESTDSSENVIQISNIKDYTADNLLTIKSEKKSTYELYDNKLINNVRPDTKKYFFKNNMPNVALEYTKLKIQDLKGIKYHIDGPGIFGANPEEYLTFNNPNSKLYIFEGTQKGKKFLDANKDEILLEVSSSIKAKDNTLESIINTFATDERPNSFNNYLSYGENLYIGLDEVAEYDISGSKFNNIYAFLNIKTKEISYFKQDDNNRHIYTPAEKPQNPNTEYKSISLEEDNDIKNKEVNISINNTDVEQIETRTIDKCYRLKVDYKQYFSKYYNDLKKETLYCIDTVKNIYDIEEYRNSSAYTEFYNYEALVENNTFVKNLIEKKLNK